MLAPAGGGNELEDFPDARTRCQFFPDNFGLPQDAAKAREGTQYDTILGGCGLHPLPRRRRAWCEFHDASLLIAADRHEFPRLALHRQVSRHSIIGGNAERAADSGDSSGVI